MATAVCFKCGEEKWGALTACGACGATPASKIEFAASLALSEHLASKSQLDNFALEIKEGRRPSISGSLLAQAWEALKDSQLMAMLGDAGGKSAQSSYSSSQTAPSAPTLATETHDKAKKRIRHSLKKTALHQNAFCLLGVTTRDDRRQIVERAEERSLELDHDACQKARADLTNPRTRLATEIAWLPGVSPKKATQLTQQMLREPMSVRSETGLPKLAHANLMAAAFEAVDSNDTAEDTAEFVQEMACLVDEISVEDVLRDINEDRVVSGFPEIKTSEQVENELVDRRRYFRNTIKDALNRLPSALLVDVMTRVVESMTDGGNKHAPELIDELVDSYEVEVQGFLQKEAENIDKLIQAIRESAKSGEAAVAPLIDKLTSVARNWDKVAQPIQISAKARGIQHQVSQKTAFSIRSLAIDLFNEHDMLEQSQRITKLLQELFSELPEVAERIEQDVDALEDIFHSRKQSEARRDEWAQEITYRAEVGVVFKDTLSISPDGITWKNQHFPLEAITWVRWGGLRHSVNGIPTGTTYTIAFGDNRSEAVIELRRGSVYSSFVEKLWRAVCIRLLTELLAALKAGNEFNFGDATIRDDGITLLKHKFFGADERIQCTWGQVQVWTADGAFVIGATEDKKAYVRLSYIYARNVHILEQAIRMAFKKPGLRRLSELLNNN